MAYETILKIFGNNTDPGETKMGCHVLEISHPIFLLLKIICDLL